jgi:hypothetical protein
MKILGAAREAPAMARRVFRTDLTQPGFSYLDMGSSGTPEEFRDVLGGLAAELGEAYRREFGRSLSFVSHTRSRRFCCIAGQQAAGKHGCDPARCNRITENVYQGRFDQQVSTEAHRDGGPDESVLLLGYEPTTVTSRLFLLDYTRAALDRGLTPQEFLERFNPLTPPGKAALAEYTTDVADFVPRHYQIAVINNGALPWELRHRGMLGVLHKALVPVPDPLAHRFITSLLGSPVAEDFPVRETN